MKKVLVRAAAVATIAVAPILASAQDKPADVRYENKAHGFSLVIPAGFKVPAPRAKAPIFITKKGTFANLNVLVDDSAATTRRAYRDENFAAIKGAGGSIDKEREHTVSGREALTFEATLPQGGKKLKLFYLAVIDEKRTILLTGTVEAATADEWRPTFTACLESFKLDGPPPAPKAGPLKPGGPRGPERPSGPAQPGPDGRIEVKEHGIALKPPGGTWRRDETLPFRFLLGELSDEAHDGLFDVYSIPRGTKSVEEWKESFKKTHRRATKVTPRDLEVSGAPALQLDTEGSVVGKNTFRDRFLYIITATKVIHVKAVLKEGSWPSVEKALDEAYASVKLLDGLK